MKLTRREFRRWLDESNAPHPLGCACWSCVLELLREIALSPQLYQPARRPLVPRSIRRGSPAAGEPVV